MKRLFFLAVAFFIRAFIVPPHGNLTASRSPEEIQPKMDLIIAQN